MYRIYRIKQKKECFVYRFISKGTIEEKILKRQISKVATSKRVVDGEETKRIFSKSHLAELYSIDYLNYVDSMNKNSKPKDLWLEKNLAKHNPLRIVSFDTHDEILEKRVDESLTREHFEEAWNTFVENPDVDLFKIKGIKSDVFGIPLDDAFRSIRVQTREDLISRNKTFTENDLLYFAACKIHKLCQTMADGDTTVRLEISIIIFSYLFYIFIFMYN